MKKSQNTDIRDLSDADILKHIMQMNPFKFEHFVGNLLNVMGFKTRVTKPTGDGGVDIEAEHETPTGASIEYVVQVKRYTNIISPKDLQALVGAMQGSKVDRCIFITTSSFSSKSVEYAEQTRAMEIVDGKKLIGLIREYGVLPETLAKAGKAKISIPVCSADEGMRLGKEAYSRGDYEESLKYFNRVTNLEPENDEAWLWKGKSGINKLIFLDFPSKELLKRLTINQYRKKVLEWIRTSIHNFTYQIDIIPEEVFTAPFEKAIEINPDNIEAWPYVNPEKAHELCDERLKSNPNDEQVYLIMGKMFTVWDMCSEDEKPGEEAKKYFNKVVELNPKNEEAWFYLGIQKCQESGVLESEYQRADLEEALSYFNKCLEINPDNHYYTELVEAIKAI
ncbi:MAG: restriction endonuclease [Candidatus Thermoplasmatota archaeon]|nr:restriction endonuclease [Candidatus Thermoplasmatota archaeon]MCG2827425.1 restriction endonuclease [Thermoplasmatales archaeon]